MIKKGSKLAKRDFEILKKPSQFIRARVLTAKIFETEGVSRFSFSISKKVAKSAVLRNRAKRTGFLALDRYLGKINSKSIQFNFTSLPHGMEEVESDMAYIIKNIR